MRAKRMSPPTAASSPIGSDHPAPARAPAPFSGGHTMRRSTRRITALSALAALALPLGGCAKVRTEEDQGEKAARVEKIGNTGQRKVILVAEAAKRLGIETAAVGEADAHHEAVPYSAVIYDAEGHSWVFTVPAD